MMCALWKGGDRSEENEQTRGVDRVGAGGRERTRSKLEMYHWDS